MDAPTKPAKRRPSDPNKPKVNYWADFKGHPSGLPRATSMPVPIQDPPEFQRECRVWDDFEAADEWRRRDAERLEKINEHRLMDIEDRKAERLALRASQLDQPEQHLREDKTDE